MFRRVEDAEMALINQIQGTQYTPVDVAGASDHRPPRGLSTP